MNSLSRSDHSTRALISLSAFRNNFGAVRSYVGPDVKIMAIVKANAYGHGAVRIASEADALGADYLGVARVEEGVELRENGITQRILVFEVVPPGMEVHALTLGLDLTIAGTEGAQRIDRAAAGLRTKAIVHAKVDTGMGRLGIDYRNAPAFIEAAARLPNLRLEGVYSHFATSDSADKQFASEQLQRFHQVLEALEKRKIPAGLRHMANSGAIISLHDSCLDMVRPGIMLYGYPPRREMGGQHALQPVLSLVSSLAFLKTVDGGESISYGRKYFTKGKTVIGTVPVGYADGYVRTLTGKACVLIRARRYPVVGTICMDHSMVDLGPDPEAQEGDEVILVGSSAQETVDAWELADHIGTIPYEITSLITGRVPRVYAD